MTVPAALLLWAALAGADPLQDLFNLSKLPEPLPDRILYEVSSHDREGRNVGDGFGGGYYQYEEQGGKVVFDEFGPGILVNFWTGADTSGKFFGDVQFLFDGDTTPSISLPAGELFSGNLPLFPFPLVSDALRSSGGNYAFSPLPFHKRLKIRFTRTPGFYHFLFYRLKDSDSLPAFNPAADYRSLADLFANNSPLASLNQGALVQPGQILTLYSRNGRGTITGLRVLPEVPYWEAVDRMILMAQWDKVVEPAVFSPLASFFGVKNGMVPFKSLPFAADSGGLSLRFPMPYFESARIYLRNDNPFPVNVAWSIADDKTPPPPGSLHFHAYHHHEIPAWSEYDYPFLSAEGHGHYAGLFFYSRTDRGRGYLEGDERAYADGRSFPDLHGTGLEDYFLAGWYFREGPFNLPVNGYISTFKGAYERMTLYRFHIADRIPYLAHLKLGIERGGGGDAPEELSSVAFFYHDDGRLLELSDTLTIGDTAQENRHRYVHGTVLDEKWLGGLFLGDTLQYSVRLSRTVIDSVQFRLTVRSDNRGVLLRRMTDWALNGQAVDVTVDGRPAGAWGVPGQNPYFRFYDADFWIPESLAAGKKKLDIKIRVRPDARTARYSEIRYEAYSVARDTAIRTQPAYINNVQIIPHSEGGMRHMFRWWPSEPPSRLDRILVYRDTAPAFSPSLENLAGLTRDLTFTDSRLSPGKTYYYRFLSLSADGIKTWGRDTLKIRTPGYLVTQGEELLPDKLTPSCSSFVFVTFNEDGDHPELPKQPEGRDTLLSFGRYLQVPFRGMGDSAAFRLTLDGADTFYFFAAYVTGPGRGIFELSVDGRPCGIAADAFSDSAGVGRVEGQIPLPLAAGEHRLAFLCRGKHHRSTAYDFGLDWMKLSTVGERYAYTPDSLKIQIVRFAPNPFNPSVRVTFELSENAEVAAQVFDVQGRLVRALLKGRLLRRRHALVWDGKNDAGLPAASGVYLIRLRAAGRTATVKGFLLR